MKKTGLDCDKCGKEIHYDTPYVSFIKTLEKCFPSEPFDEVQVMKSEQIVTLCKKCNDELGENFVDNLHIIFLLVVLQSSESLTTPLQGCRQFLPREHQDREGYPYHLSCRL